MEFDKRKILAAVGIIVVAVGIGYAIYALFFKAPTPEEEAPEAVGPAGKLTPSEQAKLGIAPAEEEIVPGVLPFAPIAGAPVTEVPMVAVTPIVSTPNAGVTLSTDGTSLRFYNQADGKFYVTDPDGTSRPLSEREFPDVQKVEWAPNKSLAAMEFPDQSKIIYDFLNEKQFSIPSHWNDIAFSPDSRNIVGKTDGPDPNTRFLFAARTDGTGAIPIEPLGENGNKVTIAPSPNNQVVALSRTAPPAGGGADRQQLLLIGKNHENFRALQVEGLNFESQWSPSGDRILYSVHSGSSGFTPMLWIDGGTQDTIGAIKSFLGVFTWAHKCTFASDSEVICAVPNPEKLEVGIGFTPLLANDTDDSMYKINIKTGLQRAIGKPEGNRTIEQVTVSKDGRYIYMKDKNSGEILKMEVR